jgi:tripartite-type tricarboxylate transporter receptor subunit TctC
MRLLHLPIVGLAALGPALIGPLAVPASAEDYPTRRILMVVPHPAGAQVDVLARLIANRMGEIWGQPVVVEDKVGANGSLGAEAVARSQPDGYTLMVSTNGPLTTNVGMFKSLDYDPLHDFESVSLICKSATLIASNIAFNVKNLADVIALAKQEPGKLSMGTGGNGTGGHFTWAELNKMANIDIVHIPYHGSVAANVDLASGAIPLASSDPTAMLPLIASGKIRPLASAGAQRLAQFPDVPTVAESAIPGFDISLWIAVSAPAGTPSAVVDKLNRTITSILDEPQSKERLISQGCNPIGPMQPSAVADFIRAEVPRWVQRVRDAHLEVQ